jgi:hypothetical protein
MRVFLVSELLVVVDKLAEHPDPRYRKRFSLPLIPQAFFPPSSHPYFDGLTGQLPGLDPKSGIIPGTGNSYIGPYIRFEPNAKPTVVPKTN